MVLTVAFINGWTDAPNSVAACVSTGVLPIKKALQISAIADFIGSVSVGLLSGKVSERIINLSSYGNDSDGYLISVFSAMSSVVIFAVISRCFGLPTSESHAVLAGIFGSSIHINGGFKNININDWINTGIGLIVSICVGYLVSYLLMKSVLLYIQKNNPVFDFKNIQILSGILTAFFHGAQDSQKFTAIAISILCSKKTEINNLNIKITVLIALIISIGILTSGDKIIKTVGNDLVKLNYLQGFSADVSGILCILIFTLCGYPLSTTHVKTSAIMGAGSVDGEINRKTASELIASWVVTFPFCVALSYIITRILIK
ncbi:MAG: inorganic phosphate transporter [Clostridia bacterium]|nr:inorganic phosphate transporter [Clostridia bacterium]